jgi:hypothetical protein
MEIEKSINLFIRTFYPDIEFKIHSQFDSHWECDLPHRWRFNVEIINYSGYVIYNPADFSPVHKLVDGKTVDLEGIYGCMDKFIPHISNKITFFYMKENGMINNIQRYTPSMSSGSTYVNEYLVG